ncbi:hypothetical protein ACIRBY_37315 [Streptomyces sp. NPDC096136]|uniref:hypothetical protein n=1 Tax=Streptomyces sp. NPDC096136 TaxID=3366076 RepID=UPI0038168275
MADPFEPRRAIGEALPSPVSTAHQLFRVPATGLPRIPRRARNLYQTQAYAGFDKASPGRAGSDTRRTYGTWGVETDEAAALGQLTRHLIQYAMTVLPTYRYTVIMQLDERGRATVTVLAVQARQPATPLDPGAHPGIRRLADSWGTRPLGAGPGLYVTAQTTT